MPAGFFAGFIRRAQPGAAGRVRTAPASALLHACAPGLSSRLRLRTTLISARVRTLCLRLLLRSRPPHGICPRRRAVYASVSPRPAPRSVYAARPRLCPRATAPRLLPRPRPGAACAACFFTPCPHPGPVRPRFPPARLHAPAPPRARDAVPAAPRAGI